MKIRKLISAVLICCILLTAMSSLAYSTSAEEIAAYVMEGDALNDSIRVYSDNLICGDVTGDGKINSIDSFELKKYVFGMPSDAQRFTIDVDGDGKRNTIDIFQIKLIIKEKSAARAYGNTTVSKTYDAVDKTALLEVTGKGSTDAFFDVDVSQKLLDEHNYAVVVWSGSSKAEFGFVDEYHYTHYSEDVSVFDGEGYTYAVAAIPADCKSSDIMEIKYSGDPAAGDSLAIDSIIFCETAEDAESAAKERLLMRNGEPKDYNYIKISFENAEDLEKLNLSSAGNKAYDAATASARLLAPMPGTEYYADIDLESYGISADQYKYVVYTAMSPNVRSDGLQAPAGEISFCAGDVTELTEGYSSMFSNIDSGQFHSSIIDLTNADFWKGNVHSLRVNYFKETTSFGFIHYLKSIVFCDTYEAAQALCVDRKETTTDVRRLFNYGLYTEGDMRMAYRMYVPYDYDGEKTYPVFTFLHGAGQRGDDGLAQVEAVVPHFFDDPATDAAFESIVIAPQCPFEYRWVESDWGLGFYYLDDVPESKPMQAYVKVLESVKETYAVDEDRFYVSGISMGGYGTWDLLMRHGDIFAAGMPLCGGADRKKADLLADIPIKTVHGTDDPEVPVTGTRRIYNAIIAAGGNKIIFTELEGYGHDVWTVTYSDPANIDWLFSHKLSDRAE